MFCLQTSTVSFCYFFPNITHVRYTPEIYSNFLPCSRDPVPLPFLTPSTSRPRCLTSRPTYLWLSSFSLRGDATPSLSCTTYPPVTVDRDWSSSVRKGTTSESGTGILLTSDWYLLRSSRRMQEIYPPTF